MAIAPARATLHVLAVEPQPNATGSTWVPQVEARFNQPIAPPWVTLRSFSTRGQCSGPVAGEFSFSPDLRTVRFHPFAATLDHFDAGEQVEVTLGTALRSMTGEVLQEPVSWHFRTLARSGAGTFLTTQNQYVGYGTLAVEGGRLNDDDQIDLVAVTLQGKVRIQLNTTPPGQHPQTYANYDLWIGTGHSSVLLRDFSGDGLLDIALADQDANLIRIGRNRGDGTDYEWTSVPTCDHPQRIASGDLNGDGVEDLVFPCQYSAQLSVQLGAGDCFFGQPATYPVGQWPIDVALRDLDVDGDLDVVVSNELSESISILRNRDPLAEPDQMFEVLPVVPLTAPVRYPGGRSRRRLLPGHRGGDPGQCSGRRLPDAAQLPARPSAILPHRWCSHREAAWSGRPRLRRRWRLGCGRDQLGRQHLGADGERWRWDALPPHCTEHRHTADPAPGGGHRSQRHGGPGRSGAGDGGDQDLLQRAGAVRDRRFETGRRPWR